MTMRCRRQLWFDVEKRYKTMPHLQLVLEWMLWFDVEKRYKTIDKATGKIYCKLWFDVEKRYKTIQKNLIFSSASCGLM